MDWNPATDNPKLELIFKEWEEKGILLPNESGILILLTKDFIVDMLMKHFPLYIGNGNYDDSKRHTSSCVALVREKATAFIAFGCIPDK